MNCHCITHTAQIWLSVELLRNCQLQNLEIYMNVRRELERLKFIPVLKVFIDPGCPDQARLKEIITRMGGLVASSAGAPYRPTCVLKYF